MVSSTETTLVNKAEQSDVDDLKDRMDEAESALENKADQSEVDALKNRVENAETAISGLQTDFRFLGLRVASVEEGLGNVPSQSDIELINEVIEVLVGRIETLEDYMRNGNGGGM
jgi:predicted  nucleic acid-binding Zn-ribbon protein